MAAQTNRNWKKHAISPAKSIYHIRWCWNCFRFGVAGIGYTTAQHIFNASATPKLSTIWFPTSSSIITSCSGHFLIFIFVSQPWVHQRYGVSERLTMFSQSKPRTGTFFHHFCHLFSCFTMRRFTALNIFYRITMNSVLDDCPIAQITSSDSHSLWAVAYRMVIVIGVSVRQFTRRFVWKRVRERGTITRCRAKRAKQFGHLTGDEVLNSINSERAHLAKFIRNENKSCRIE